MASVSKSTGHGTLPHTHGHGGKKSDKTDELLLFRSR